MIEGSEYWFVAEPHLNYEEAILYCASNHSSLATLTSYAGLKAIKNKIANVIQKNVFLNIFLIFICISLKNISKILPRSTKVKCLSQVKFAQQHSNSSFPVRNVKCNC